MLPPAGPGSIKTQAICDAVSPLSGFPPCRKTGPNNPANPAGLTSLDATGKLALSAPAAPYGRCASDNWIHPRAAYNRCDGPNRSLSRERNVTVASAGRVPDVERRFRSDSQCQV